MRQPGLMMVCAAMLWASGVAAKTAPLIDGKTLELRWQAYASEALQTRPASFGMRLRADGGVTGSRDPVQGGGSWVPAPFFEGGGQVGEGEFCDNTIRGDYELGRGGFL